MQLPDQRLLGGDCADSALFDVVFQFAIYADVKERVIGRADNGFAPVRSEPATKFKSRFYTLVGLIGFEPMTLRLSSACSNQLSYRPAREPEARNFEWKFRNSQFSFAPPCGKWRHGDSNPGHPACKAGALPTELYPRGKCSVLIFKT